MVVLKDEKKAYEVVAKGDIRRFEELVEEDNIDTVLSVKLSTPPYLNPPLHAAAKWRNAEMVEEILWRNPALAREINSEMNSALHIAAANGDVKIASLLVSKAPEMCWLRNDSGKNPIHIAAERGHSEVLECLIRVQPFAAWEKAYNGMTVLHLCGDQFRAIDVLVTNLPDLVYVEGGIYGPETMLHYAVRRNNLEMVLYWLENKKMEKCLRQFMGKTSLQILSDMKLRSGANPVIINLLEKAGNSFVVLPNITKQKHKDNKVGDLFFYHLMAVVWTTTASLFLLTTDFILFGPALVFTMFAVILHLYTEYDD